MQKVLSMHRIRCWLLAFGFVWMALWALAGSLLGYRLQEDLLAGGTPWLESLTRELLRSTHAHMNAMSMVCMIVGLACPMLARAVPFSWIKGTAAALPACIVLFGLGLTLEAMDPPRPGHLSLGALLAAFGGSVFIGVTLFLGAAFVRAAQRQP
jgi:hypothetical protein